MTRKSIHFVSLGCPKNRVDSEVMLGVSEQAGYDLAEAADDADVIVVNTCGFIESAKQESIETILDLSELKQSGRCERLVVAGCLSQRYPEQLAEEMPEVDHFLGSSDMLKLGPILELDRGQHGKRMLVGDPADYIFQLSDPRRLSQGRHFAYVKIAEGCSRQCSFCAIPSFRGKQRSRPVADVVAEVQRLVQLGTTEVNLISQDTISYGKDLADKPALTDLVRGLCDVDGLGWLRVFYLYPEAIDPALLSLFSQPGSPLVPYIDMPFQHASDAMLKRMRRGYRARRQREMVEEVRAAIPGVSIRTAFIVGHPGETEEDFEALCELVRWGRFQHVGVFRYSHEDGTHSGSMDALVPEDVAEARWSALMDIQRDISRSHLQAMVGQEVQVMVEGESEESELLLQGRHAGQAPEIDGVVHLTNGTAQPGELRRALITHAGDYDLVGDLSCGGEDPQTAAKAKARRRLPLA